MEVVTKRQAIDGGLTHYFTGKSCKRGHIEKRSVKTSACLECLRIASRNVYAERKSEILERQRKYRIENPEKAKDTFKRNYEKNKAKRLSHHAVYRAENKEKERDRHKKYRLKNLETLKSKEKIYRDSNPEKIRARHANRRARVKNAEGTHSAQDVRDIFEKQKGRCAGCGEVLISYHVDHIYPISLGGSNWPCNLQILCQPCNLNKHAKDPMEWAKEHGRLL